jgi:SAM-dependent methyltransferase
MPACGCRSTFVGLYDDDLAYIQATAFGGLAAGAAPAIVALLRQNPVPVRRVVDVGCGAGVTTRALTDAGYDTLAVEPSAALLEHARRAAPLARFVESSAYDAPLEACEAILAVGEPLTYHEPDVDAEARLRPFFRKAARALVPGGLLVFDVILAEGPPLDARGWSSGDDWVILWEATEDREARRLTRRIETFRRRGDAYRRGCEVHGVKLFGEEALTSWLQDERFEVATASSYGEQALGPRRRAFFATRR